MALIRLIDNHDEVKGSEVDEGAIPMQFLCPISLEMMQDPVTLCTGITYDRPNIHMWLNTIGQDTCPVSNQRLVSKDLVPNLVLRSLILRWQYSVNYMPTPSPPPPPPQFSAQNAHRQDFHSLVQRIQYISSPPHLLRALVSLHTLLAEHQNSSHVLRLALSTLTNLLRRSAEKVVLEKALELADMVLEKVLAEGGAKGFLYVDLVPTVVCYTLVGVSVDATILSLRILCRVCEQEERCCRAAAEIGALSKLLLLLQEQQSCAQTRKHALHLCKLLHGQRRYLQDLDSPHCEAFVN